MRQPTGTARPVTDLGALTVPATTATFEQFCRRHHRRLVGLLALQVGSQAVAEELAQEALVRLHLQWERVASQERPERWLNRVAVNLARSWWRRRFAEHRANERRSALDEQTGPASDDRTAVWSAVAALPRRQRTVVAWRYYVGLSVAETAIEMRCREGTVKSLTSQALARLRADLATDDDSPSTTEGRTR